MAGVSQVRKNLRRIRKFCCLSTDKASADLETMHWYCSQWLCSDMVLVAWQRDTSVGCSNVNQQGIAVNGGFTSYRVSGLEPSNRYTIIVTGCNSVGAGPVSNSIAEMTSETSERHPKLVTLTYHLQWRIQDFR